MTGTLWYLAKQRLSLKSLLKSAIRTGEIYVLYQPIVDLHTKEYVGAEALIRWRRPDGTDIRPDVFIPIAEETGLIRQITTCMIETAARDSTHLVRKNPQFHIGINLSGVDLESQSVIDTLHKVIDRESIQAKNLLLEATERTLLKAHLASQVMNKLHSMGIAIAIDDFGTGYSSLSYLTDLKFDYLKIDKSFVDTIGKGAATSHVIFYIIKMAHSLGLAMIAEGVENQYQADFLEKHGVQLAQGWLFAKPMSIEALAERMHAS
jgi:sensor c-di-GMP phosphodiesterase-like protein